VLACSGHSDPAIVIETLDDGAHAYVSKEEGRDHLVEAVLATRRMSISENTVGSTSAARGPSTRPPGGPP
jgi:DNA-binding NarL/FixJ family response regulator